jgi:hypothetical protein
MDSHNLFATPLTYRLMRAEYLVALAVSVILLVVHVADVRWWAFVLLFVYIDAIGYIPGAIAYRRSGGHMIPKVYYVLYNSMHSLVSAAVVAGVWCLVIGPEWALLALPIHLFGDRALFGNFLKPFGLSFEPVTHPDYKEFVSRYEQHSAAPDPTATIEPAGPADSRRLDDVGA